MSLAELGEGLWNQLLRPRSTQTPRIIALLRGHPSLGPSSLPGIIRSSGWGKSDTVGRVAEVRGWIAESDMVGAVAVRGWFAESVAVGVGVDVQGVWAWQKEKEGDTWARQEVNSLNCRSTSALPAGPCSTQTQPASDDFACDTEAARSLY